jgi:hypothetical protein
VTCGLRFRGFPVGLVDRNTQEVVSRVGSRARFVSVGYRPPEAPDRLAGRSGLPSDRTQRGPSAFGALDSWWIPPVSRGSSHRATLNVRSAGVGSTLPARSIARTRKMWEPSESAGDVLGELQKEKAAESKRHWKLEPGSLEAKVKVGVRSLVGPAGPAVIVVSGTAVSTVKEREAGVGSVLPTASMARTSKLWGPSAREL